VPESNDGDWTPVPGEALSGEEAARIIASFEGRFRAVTEGKHPQIPTWVTFDSAASRRATVELFTSAPIEADAEVFLYFERRQIWRTTMGDVRRYVAALEPWEDWDLYVFDASIDWCIAYTHPQMGNERLAIAAGTLARAD
jgi:hypothetical protein